MMEYILKCPGGGKKQFLDNLTESEINNKDYFSDVHLVYNNEKDMLELFYRLTNKDNDAPNGEILRLLRKTTNDGLNWSERENLVSSNQAPDIGSIYISPAIVLQNQEYIMWYVSSYGDNRSLSCAKSTDMKSFYDVKICSLVGRSCDPWHIDCHKVDNEYYLLVYEFNNELSLWKSADGIHFHFVKVVLSSSKVPGCFFHALYRSCVTKNHMNGYSIYFSAQNRKEMGFGIATGDDIFNCNVINGNGSKSFSLFFMDIIDKYFYAIGKLVKKFWR